MHFLKIHWRCINAVIIIKDYKTTRTQLHTQNAGNSLSDMQLISISGLRFIIRGVDMIDMHIKSYCISLFSYVIKRINMPLFSVETVYVQLHRLDIRDTYTNTNSIMENFFIKHETNTLYRMPSKLKKIHSHGVDLSKN